MAEPDFFFDSASDIDAESASAVVPWLVGSLLFVTAPVRVTEMDVCSVRAWPGIRVVLAKSMSVVFSVGGRPVVSSLDLMTELISVVSAVLPISVDDAVPCSTGGMLFVSSSPLEGTVFESPPDVAAAEGTITSGLWEGFR